MTTPDLILDAFHIPQAILDQHALLNTLIEENPIKIPVKKAAQFMGIHEDTLREMIDEGRCPFALGMQKSKYRNRYTVIPTYNFYMWQTHFVQPGQRGAEGWGIHEILVLRVRYAVVLVNRMISKFHF